MVPPQGRRLVLQELHDTHPGISKMKVLAHSLSGGREWTVKLKKL